MPELKLGAKVKDKVTGLMGQVTGLAVYLYEATAARVESMRDGKPVSEWVETARLELSE